MKEFIYIHFYIILTHLSNIQLAGKINGMYDIMNTIDVQSTHVLVMP